MEWLAAGQSRPQQSPPANTDVRIGIESALNGQTQQSYNSHAKFKGADRWTKSKAVCTRAVLLDGTSQTIMHQDNDCQLSCSSAIPSRDHTCLAAAGAGPFAMADAPFAFEASARGFSAGAAGTTAYTTQRCISIQARFERYYHSMSQRSAEDGTKTLTN